MSPAPANTGPDVARPLRVLAVEDNLDAARALAALLRRRGYEVRSRGDGPAALDAAAAFHPEAAVLDLALPGMDGWELARRLRRRCGPGLVLVVAVTGHGDADSVRRSREAGIDHHLVKPLVPEQLLELLAGVRRAAAQ